MFYIPLAICLMLIVLLICIRVIVESDFTTVKTVKILVLTTVAIAILISCLTHYSLH